MAQKMEQFQAQSQVLAPQLRQSLKILQVPALELRNVILEELQLNPTIEELPLEEVSIEEQLAEKKPEEKSQEVDPQEAIIDELTISEELWSSRSFDLEPKQPSTDSDEKHTFWLNSIAATISLQDHLLQQVGFLDIDDKTVSVLRYLVGSLDERGFLTLDPKEIAQGTQMPLQLVHNSIQILKQLDPPGVGCVDTRSCLLEQLRVQGKRGSLPFLIIEHCYDWLLRNKVLDLAHHFRVEKEVIQNAIEEISHLDPAPGRRFEVQMAQGIIPDVSIYKGHFGEWIVDLNNSYIPQLRIGPTYKDILSKSGVSESDKNYLRLKMRSGRFLIQAIAQRQKTIERIAYALLDIQHDFFEEGPSKLRPLTLQVLAEKLEVHETTISRAIANKFMETPFGIFEFKYFFTKGLNSDEGESIANTIIKKKIAKLIAQEDKSKPLSDQRLVDLLLNENIRIARRTVAKYREELAIPATNLRRKYE